jgi:septum formation protein
MPAHIDEDVLKVSLLAQRKGPSEIALALAKAKAIQVSNSHPDDLVLGADQVLQFDDDLISKCADMAAARRLLLRLRGKPHRLISALVLAKAGTVGWTHSGAATLNMRTFS